jgi:hypothetical protein
MKIHVHIPIAKGVEPEIKRIIPWIDPLCAISVPNTNKEEKGANRSFPTKGIKGTITPIKNIHKYFILLRLIRKGTRSKDTCFDCTASKRARIIITHFL